MNFYRFIILLVVTGLLSCTPGRKLSQIKDEAKAAYNAEDYKKAFLLYDNLIKEIREKGEFVGGENYNLAGLSAWAIGDTTNALAYLGQAYHTDAANEQTFYALSKAYRAIDNLSKEISCLEQYLERFPEAPGKEEFEQRLFITYVESMNWGLADTLWSELDEEAREKEPNLEGYLIVQENLDREKAATNTAKQLLEINENNTAALRWLAERHYWLAENRYRKETKAYEKNRTNRQYAKLLKAFEILNTDFRISLNYFLQLYKIDPSPSTAKYIGNIYTRFDNKEKARYYLNLSKE